MPSSSKKQARPMAAVAHNPAFAKKVGIPVSVGKEFNQADKGRKFKEGGAMATDKLKKLFKGKESMKEELAEAKAIKSGKITPMEYAKGEKMEGHKKGGRIASKGEHSVQKQSKRGAEMVKMAKGGLASGHKSADGCAVRGKTRAMAPAMKRGGKVC